MLQMTRLQKASFILNCVIFLSTIFAIISLLTGFRFMTEPGEPALFSAANVSSFKYFTVDSNILAGLAAIVAAVFQILKAKGCIKSIHKSISILKLAATTGVTLTMLVTVFFLAPFQFGFAALFVDSNLFMHLLIPVMCIVTFVFFEPAEFSALQTLAGIIPMLIYTVFYAINIILHLENGQPSKTYDWYGFLGGKLSSLCFVIPIMLGVTWLISFLLQAANRKNRERIFLTEKITYK